MALNLNQIKEKKKTRQLLRLSEVWFAVVHIWKNVACKTGTCKQ
jgi:hypothetical protein